MHTPKEIKHFLKAKFNNETIEKKLMRIYYDNCSIIQNSYHMKMFLQSAYINLSTKDRFRRSLA